jgi:hypothetical protein
MISVSGLGESLAERIPVGRLNRYLWPSRSGVTCGKGGPHSGSRYFADKDEAAGSSPARPTTSADQRKRQSAPPESAAAGMHRTKNSYLVTLPCHGCVAPRLRAGPFELHTRQPERPQQPSTTCLVGLARPDPGWITTGRSGSPPWKGAGRWPFGTRPHPAVLASPTGRGVRWGARCGSDVAVPAPLGGLAGAWRPSQGR